MREIVLDNLEWVGGFFEFAVILSFSLSGKEGWPLLFCPFAKVINGQKWIHSLPFFKLSKGLNMVEKSRI